MTLNELNFQKLIQYAVPEVTKYSFGDYRENGYRHAAVQSYCTLCDEKGINTCSDSQYKLCNISHGSHTKDFLSAGRIDDLLNWNSAGVMFVMEGPRRITEFMKQEKLKKKAFATRNARQNYGIGFTKIWK